jgi:hypothetical protein
MAFDETFRPVPRFDETEVFELIGELGQVRELRPSNFEGPVAEWAEDRMRKFGETIIPRHVYVEPTAEGPHRVAWIYHDGIEIRDGEMVTFCMHHVACDCSPEAEKAESQEEKEEILGSCSALESVIRKRAYLVNATYGMENILSRNYDHDRPAHEQSSPTQDFVLRSMLYLLEHDYRHPESWIANVESGWDLINLMANVMQLRPEDIRWFAGELQEKKMVQTDGQVIELTQKVKRTIDRERLAA